MSLFDTSPIAAPGRQARQAPLAERMRPRALDEFVIDGIETTLPLFRALVREKDVIDGDYHIHWLEDFLAGGGMNE